MLGDVNIDLLSKTNCEAKYLRRLIRSSNVLQMINVATRVTEKTSTLIDHIYVEKGTKLEKCGVIDTSDITDYRGKQITDHKLIYGQIKYYVSRKFEKMLTYRDFSKFNINTVVRKIASIDWNIALQTNEVQKIETFITSNIRAVYDELAPMVVKRATRKKTPWMTPEISEMIKEKNKLRRCYQKSKMQIHWNKYKDVRNKLNCLIRNSKKYFYKYKISNTKGSKEFWSCLRECDVVSDEIGNRNINLDVNNVNKYFVNMGSYYNVDKSATDLYCKESYSTPGTFSFKKVSIAEIKTAMNEIKSKAVGSDQLSIDMIKAVSPYCIDAITHLINQSLTKGIFPDAWKLSIVHPLPKTDNPNSVEHLRPISVLPAMSKVLEKVVAEQVERYIEGQDILPKCQSGFRKNYSTCTALLNLFSDLYEAKDKNKNSTLVFLDYSQAFDSICHDLLVRKLKYLGFDNTSLDWFKSYLANRTQMTKLGLKMSNVLQKSRGVPQGSCLGPILFNVYTADIANVVKNCSIHMYADDCQLLYTYSKNDVDEAFEIVNKDLKSVEEWSMSQGLKLNVNKCSVLHVAPPDLQNALKIGAYGKISLSGHALEICSQVKTLGVILDDNLTLSQHVSYACQKALGRLRGLYRLRYLLPEDARVQIVKSLVLSAIEYCLPAYGNSILKGDCNKIQRTQNAAVRFIYGLRKREHVSTFRSDAKLLPIEVFCKASTCVLIHKTLSLGKPLYLREKLPARRDVSKRSTRQNDLLHVPKVSHEVGRRAFAYFGPKLYNSVPSKIREKGLTGFKTNIKMCSFHV